MHGAETYPATDWIQSRPAIDARRIHEPKLTSSWINGTHPTRTFYGADRICPSSNAPLISGIAIYNRVWATYVPARLRNVVGGLSENFQRVNVYSISNVAQVEVRNHLMWELS